MNLGTDVPEILLVQDRRPVRYVRIEADSRVGLDAPSRPDR